MQPTFELFDHTADTGIRIFAGSLSELIQPATDGMYSVIGQLVSAGEGEQIVLQIQGDDPATMLRDYLQELLVFFDRDHRFAKEVECVTFDSQQLCVRVQLFDIDHERCVFLRELKAITYHELAIHTLEDGYEATVIVDI